MSEYMTPRLGLPMLVAGQAQKEMTHNEALLLVDALIGGAAVEVGIDSPPSAPEEGACWIIGSAPVGAWEGQACALAISTAGGWRFVQAREGMQLWAGAGSGFVLFHGGEWRANATERKVFVEDTQVVGKRLPEVAEPAGGVVVDGQARAVIIAVLEALRVHGLIASD